MGYVSIIASLNFVIWDLKDCILQKEELFINPTFINNI